MPRVLIFVVGLVVLAIVVLGWWWSSSTPGEPTPLPSKAPEQVVESPPEAPQPTVDEPVTPDTSPLPPLDESDAVVRSEVLAVLPPPVEGSVAPSASTLMSWLDGDDLIRRFAVLADNAAKGGYPWRQLAFLAPQERLPVIADDERIQLDPNGYGRFDAFVDAALLVPPSTAATLLTRYSPLLQEALGELGEGERDPGAIVLAAIDQALATPVIEGPIELVQPKVFYEFADPEIEGLPPLQKQLVRMGPDNVRRLKAHLTEVRAALSG